MQSSGRRRDIGLGSLDKLSLADARDARDTVRTQFHAGVDPVAARKRSAGVSTFSDAAKTVYAALKPAWRCGKHNHQWIRSLETYAFPTLGEVPVNRGGSVCLNSPSRLLSGGSAGFMPLREAVG